MLKSAADTTRFQRASDQSLLIYFGQQITLDAHERVRKLLRLLEKATNKSERYYESLLAPWESLRIFFRMIRACVTGKYCAPADSILMVVAAVIYFLSPFDLVPDAIPVFGLIDDAAVISYRNTPVLFASAFTERVVTVDGEREGQPG